MRYTLNHGDLLELTFSLYQTELKISDRDLLYNSYFTSPVPVFILLVNFRNRF